MERKDLAKSIYNTSHLEGEFLLRSGQISNEYFDKYRFEADPSLLNEIANHLAELVPNDIDAFAALEMGGIPVATALSLKTGIPCVFVRKKAKEYGTRKLAEGLEIEGKKLCVIEDVITTGGQVVESTSELRQLGATVDNVLCVIYRGQGENGQEPKLEAIGLQQKSLFTMSELSS